MAKRLIKGKKMVFGVCSGVANYLDLDPTIIRAVFAISVLLFGTGLVVYLVLALIMPES